MGEHGSIENTENFGNEQGIDKEDLEKVLKSLLVDDFLSLEVIERKVIELTEEGQSYAKNGSPEYQFVQKIAMGEQVDMAEMENRVGKQIAKIGFGKAMKQKWIKKDGDKFERIAENPVDEDQSNLAKFVQEPSLEAHEKKVVDQYKKRKHLNVKSIKCYKCTKAANFATTRAKLETELTAAMIRSGEWKNTQYKSYNFNAAGLEGHGGHLHPLMMIRENFKEIFLEMGFTEMPTNRFVESSFWNFDALF